MATRLYRIVRTWNPTLLDFQSNASRGLPSPISPDAAALWDGISCYNTKVQARRSALKRPVLGQFIAELEIPDEAPVRIRRTLASAGHHTVWGEAMLLLSCVVRVEPV